MRYHLKIFFIGFLVMLVVMHILAFEYYHDLKDQYVESFNNRCLQITEDLSQMLRNYVLTGNTYIAYNYVEKIADNRHIKYFNIFTNTMPTNFGREISSTFAPPASASYRILNNGLAVADVENDRMYYISDNVFYDSNREHLAATLLVGFSTENVYAYIWDLKIKFAVLMIIMSCGSILIFVFVKRAFTRYYKILLSYFLSITKGQESELPRQLTEYTPIITEAQRMARDLISYQRELQRNAASAAIGQSTAMVAHDVRKPLTSMKALLTSLPMIKDDPVQLSSMIANVDRNIVQTNAMLNDVLEFSRDSTALDVKENNPHGLIVSALGDALRNHRGSNIRIEYKFGHRYALAVDSTRIIRVLTNIVDNALDAMASPQTGKTVGSLYFETYEVERDGRAYGGIIASDDGPGIPDSVLSRIFDPFFTSGKKGGTGLGLAICRKVINLHGGTIEAMNRQDGKGAQFIIELPMGKDRVGTDESELIRHSSELETFRMEEAVRVDYGDTANTSEFLRINKERGRPSYMLIVDDEPLFRESVRVMLGNLSQVRDHVKVIEADSAEMGLKIFEGREFDYIIADIDLGRGNMNGYEFSQIILEKYPNTHVLIHSNKRRAELDKNVREIKSNKFLGFLPKPMRAEELLQFLACKTFEADKSVIATVSEKKKILILNDDDALLFSFKILLKAPDVQVLTASNVSTALKHIAEQKVDVILSDVNLGEGEPDGYEFLKNVRETDKTIPFYMVSGYSAAEEGPKAKDLGASGYLQLPVDQKQLRDLI